MHVGLMIYGGLENVSGGFLYDRMLVRHLRGRGDRVEVISLGWPGYGRGLLQNLSPGLWRRLRQAPFDVLLQDELAHPSLFLPNRCLRGALPYPVISLVLHLRSCETHPTRKQRLYRWVEQRYLESVDGFICVSDAIFGEVKNLGGDGRPGVVAYPGGDHLPGSTTREDVIRRALQPGPLEIAAVANLIPRKGIHTLIAALSRLPRDLWSLQVAGNLTDDPAHVRSLRRQISALGLADQVLLLGTLSAAELSDLFTRTQVLAVPASYEALGIVHLEAMRAGLPAIGSTAGGAREIITHGRDGFLVAPGEVTGLTDFLGLLLNDRRRLLAMSLAAWERSRTHPTWEEGMSRAREFLISRKDAKAQRKAQK